MNGAIYSTAFLRPTANSGKKIPQTCVMTALWLRQRCGLRRSHLEIKRLWWGRDEAFFPASVPPLWDRDRTPAKMQAGVQGSGWKDVKEQYFEVNKRQKIAVARKAGKEEDQAGDLQGGPVVRKCRDVDWNCRPPEGSTAGSGAYSARQGPRRLSGPDCRNVRRNESPRRRTRGWNLSTACYAKTGSPVRGSGVVRMM
jgi:hypothetical protein